MKQLVNFLGKAAELTIVFAAVFVAPAIMLSIIWMRLSVYKACVTSPVYCAVMSVVSLLSLFYFIDWRIENRKRQECSGYQ